MPFNLIRSDGPVCPVALTSIILGYHTSMTERTSHLHMQQSLATWLLPNVIAWGIQQVPGRRTMGYGGFLVLLIVTGLAIIR